jgi:hypothetical protein
LGESIREEDLLTTRVLVSSWAVHERLDDEVMVINLESGKYFALDGTASDCWARIAGGALASELVDLLVSSYEVDTQRATTDVEAFLSQLSEGGVVEMAPAVIEPGSPSGEPASGRRQYRAPTIEAFDDLEDLLLLDPVHEVDEQGWPIAGKGPA